MGKAKVHSQQIESLERDLEGHQEKAFDISRLIIDTTKLFGHESQKMFALMILVIGFFKEETDSMDY